MIEVAQKHVNRLLGKLEGQIVIAEYQNDYLLMARTYVILSIVAFQWIILAWLCAIVVETMGHDKSLLVGFAVSSTMLFLEYFKIRTRL